MAITVKWYGRGLLACLRNDVDLEADTLRMTLHTGTYVPNQDTDDFFNDATNELATANGYTAGGVTLASSALSYDATTDQVRWDFADPSWTFSGAVTFRVAVIRKARGGASSADEVIAYLLWDSDQTISTSYTLQIDANGLLYIDAT
jgi:hypothetical protein